MTAERGSGTARNLNRRKSCYGERGRHWAESSSLPEITFGRARPVSRSRNLALRRFTSPEARQERGRWALPSKFPRLVRRNDGKLPDRDGALGFRVMLGT